MVVSESVGCWILLALIATCMPASAIAGLSDWEANFGAEVPLLSGEDDAAENVTLSFEFPFAGAGYSVLSIGNNGGVALGNDPAEVHVLHWHIWGKNEFQADFTDAGFPSVLAFNTDLDQTVTGVVYFNDFGDRAVITWDGVGTNRTPAEAFISFQMQLFADGRIIFGYQGISGDLIADLDEGIVVGFSKGVGDIPGGSVDYSNTPFSAASDVYELWCSDEDPTGDPLMANCFEPGRDNNSGFDLGNSNLFFMPDGTGGYLVSSEPEAVMQPPPAPPRPSSGGGGQGPAGLLAMLCLVWLRKNQGYGVRASSSRV